VNFNIAEGEFAKSNNEEEDELLAQIIPSKDELLLGQRFWIDLTFC
jgi:hypothetical protein